MLFKLFYVIFFSTFIKYGYSNDLKKLDKSVKSDGCPKNAKRVADGSPCPPKCSDVPGEPIPCPRIFLGNICQCKKSYVLNYKGECVKKSECPKIKHKKCPKNMILSTSDIAPDASNGKSYWEYDTGYPICICKRKYYMYKGKCYRRRRN